MKIRFTCTQVLHDASGTTVAFKPSGRAEGDDNPFANGDPQGDFVLRNLKFKDGDAFDVNKAYLFEISEAPIPVPKDDEKVVKDAADRAKLEAGK